MNGAALLSFQAAAEVGDAPDGFDHHPGPRYTGKCTSCGRFVAKATVRWDPRRECEYGTCGQCGSVEVS